MDNNYICTLHEETSTKLRYSNRAVTTLTRHWKILIVNYHKRRNFRGV